MKQEKTEYCPDYFLKRSHYKKCHCHHQNSSAIYGLGVFGALFYFLQNTTTFTAILVGVFKSIFWPAFVLYRCLQILGI